MKIPRRLPRYLVEQTGLQSLLVIAILVFGFLLLENAFVRWDLTEDNRFTISDASRRMAAELEDPLTVRVYMSGNVPPRYEPLQQQVRDVLEEYEAASKGKVKVELYDPIESRTAENEAKNYGIQPVQLPVYEATSVQVLQVYGGIVLVYRDRASEVINIAERYPEGYEGLSVLEYEISSKIWQLSHERPKIGLAGYLEGMPKQPPMGPNRQPPRSEFQGLRRLLGESFEIEEVDLKEDEPDPEEIPLLALVRPREMSDVEVFRLDQYLVKGGRALMFVTQGTVDVTPWDRKWLYRSFKTGLDDWFSHMGLRVPNEFVLHGVNANLEEIEVQVFEGMRGRMAVPSWWRPRISDKKAIDQANPAVRNLDTISFFWPHPVDIIEGKVPEGVEATVLVRSHESESWRWKDHTRISMSSVDERADGPRRSELQSSPLVVSLEGTFPSYYADHPVPPSLGGGEESETESPDGEGGGQDEATEGPEGEIGEGDEPESGEEGQAPEEAEETGEEAETADRGPDVIEESVRPTHLVVVGNAVFVSDVVLGGQQANERARQAALLAFNLIDWLARSPELIALRAKKYSNRTIVDQDFESDLTSLKEEAEAGEMTEQAFREEFDKARDRHMARRKRWRWINIIIPSLAVLVAAALVWIFRAARRATPARVLDVPPASSPVPSQEEGA